MGKMGFDNKKYIKLQSQNIAKRVAKFNKLYLEFGGKLFDDNHASRVLPGFEPDSKIKMLLNLKDKVEMVLVINANDIEKNKMRSDLDNVSFPNESIGDTIDGITYRFANSSDIPKILECTDDAEQSFSKYYKNEKLYDEETKQVVLIATCNNEVCGTLIISIETEAPGLGSVGCTTVSHKYRGKHIGVNMVVLGTKYLKSLGLKNGYLGYTYSGLDKMYGYAGYKICVYYAMAQKQLNLEKNHL